MHDRRSDTRMCNTHTHTCVWILPQEFWHTTMQACTHEWEMISSEHCKMQMKIYNMYIYTYTIFTCAYVHWSNALHHTKRICMGTASSVSSSLTSSPCTAVTRVWYLAVFGSENSCFMQKMVQGSCFFYVKCVNWYFDAKKSLFFSNYWSGTEDIAPTYNTMQFNEYFTFVKNYVRNWDIGLAHDANPATPH